MTDEIPAAKNGTASPGAYPTSRVTPRADAACTASGGIVPYTTDTFTPAFSNTLPFCNTREIPPPPLSRTHASSWNDAPSNAVTCSQILSCAARIITSNRLRIDDDDDPDADEEASPSSSRTSVLGFSVTYLWSVQLGPDEVMCGVVRGRVPQDRAKEGLGDNDRLGVKLDAGSRVPERSDDRKQGDGLDSWVGGARLTKVNECTFMLAWDNRMVAEIGFHKAVRCQTRGFALWVCAARRSAG